MAHDHTLHSHGHGHEHAHSHDHGHDHAADAHAHGIWTRDHVFLGQGHSSAETRAKWAAIVTAVFMVVEIVCGLAYKSMALLADGAHINDAKEVTATRPICRYPLEAAYTGRGDTKRAENFTCRAPSKM